MSQKVADIDFNQLFSANFGYTLHFLTHAIVLKKDLRMRLLVVRLLPDHPKVGESTCIPQEPTWYISKMFCWWPESQPNSSLVQSQNCHYRVAGCTLSNGLPSHRFPRQWPIQRCTQYVLEHYLTFSPEHFFILFLLYFYSLSTTWVIKKPVLAILGWKWIP